MNNEKIDIINYSTKPEILISRALSPAKPAELYIDNDRRYCIALFNDDELEFAIGKGGVNINLASRVTNYKIDAFGKKEYEKQQRDQNTLLGDIPDFPAGIADNLQKKGINTISDLLGTDEELLLKTKGMTEEKLETIYSLIQAFIESDDEKALTVEEVLDELDTNGATEDKAEVAEDTSTPPEPTAKVGEQES